jgi:hypothetical protein
MIQENSLLGPMRKKKKEGEMSEKMVEMYFDLVLFVPCFPSWFPNNPMEIVIEMAALAEQAPNNLRNEKSY